MRVLVEDLFYQWETDPVRCPSLPEGYIYFIPQNTRLSCEASQCYRHSNVN